MSQVKIKRLDGMAFAARGKTNHWVMMDTSEELGGTAAAGTPMEFILFGLGGCTAMDVQSILTKMKVPVERFEIEIDAQRAQEHPRVYTRIDLTFHFWGADLPQDRLERAVELSETKYCSASAMLAETADIQVRVENHDTA